MAKFNDPLSRRKEIFGVPFQDMAELPEHERILAWGKMIMEGGKIGCFVDAEGKDGHEKADRYIRTLLSLFPDVTVKKHNGPTPGVITMIGQRRETK